jgi:hypothetical protein
MINVEFANAEASERKFRSWSTIYAIPMVVGIMVLMIAMSSTFPSPRRSYLFSRHLKGGQERLPPSDGVSATGPCFPVKPKDSTTIDENIVNIIFVGSGFKNEPAGTFQAQVEETFSVFGSYNMFGIDNTQYNAYYVEPTEGMSSSFCHFNCYGIQRLMCCDVPTAKRLTNRCLPASANVQTVVIHNDPQYGGAGYTSDNMATVSIHPSGPLIAIHEVRGTRLSKLVLLLLRLLTICVSWDIRSLSWLTNTNMEVETATVPIVTLQVAPNGPILLDRPLLGTSQFLALLPAPATIPLQLNLPLWNT